MEWILLGLLSKEEATEDKLNENIFRIVQRFNHSLYKMEKPIVLSPTIRPVCLYTSEELPTDYDSKASVTGWGRTDAGEWRFA